MEKLKRNILIALAVIVGIIVLFYFILFLTA